MTFLIFFAVGVVYSSLFEWILHRYVMHAPVGKFRYAYEAHALTHHGTFRADSSYHLQREPDRHTIHMAWWNGPVLVAIASSPFWVVWLWLYGSIAAPLGVTAALACYYAAYEYLHWCMHLPRGRWFERTAFFRYINGHHLVHHHRPEWNLNVVLPIADILLGTNVRRATRPFPQPGDPLPDVQPDSPPDAP